MFLIHSLPLDCSMNLSILSRLTYPESALPTVDWILYTDSNEENAPTNKTTSQSDESNYLTKVLSSRMCQFDKQRLAIMSSPRIL